MPSKKILDQKAQVVADLAAEFKQAQAMVFVEYRGLTVAQDTAMRAEFRKAGVSYQVIKNTLSGRAPRGCWHHRRRRDAQRSDRHRLQQRRHRGSGQGCQTLC